MQVAICGLGRMGAGMARRAARERMKLRCPAESRPSNRPRRRRTYDGRARPQATRPQRRRRAPGAARRPPRRRPRLCLHDLPRHPAAIVDSAVDLRLETRVGAQRVVRGDRVTGGELPAMIVIDAVARLNADGSQSSDALPFHLGGAVAYTDASSTASPRRSATAIG